MHAVFLQGLEGLIFECDPGSGGAGLFRRCPTSRLWVRKTDRMFRAGLLFELQAENLFH